MLITRIIKWIFRRYVNEDKWINKNIKGSIGALKDHPDKRDYVIGTGLPIEDSVDLREYVKEVKAQGDINSCVACAICSSIELQLQLDSPKRHMPLSERYNYYFGRKMSGLLNSDIGMYPREAIKSAISDGISTEILWPYSDDINVYPSMISRSIAHIYGASILQYYRAFSNTSIKEQLSMAKPVLISIPIYAYWIGNKSGNIRLPKQTDKLIGHHELLIVGHFDKYFIALNSWGERWGKSGFCNLPMDYKRTDSWVVELK